MQSEALMFHRVRMMSKKRVSLRPLGLKALSIGYPYLRNPEINIQAGILPAACHHHCTIFLYILYNKCRFIKH